jgi:uncharacterized protein HemX
MPDLNLFGESGFQNVTKTETILDNTKKQKHAEMPVQSQKVKREQKENPKKSFASESLIAFLLAVGIGASVVWYLQYRSDVKTTITELSIEEFRNIDSATE